jgi:hypothetical protein
MIALRIVTRMGRNAGLPRGSVNLAGRSGLGRLGQLSEYSLTLSL